MKTTYSFSKTRWSGFEIGYRSGCWKKQLNNSWHVNTVEIQCSFLLKSGKSTQGWWWVASPSSQTHAPLLHSTVALTFLCLLHALWWLPSSSSHQAFSGPIQHPFNQRKMGRGEYLGWLLGLTPYSAPHLYPFSVTFYCQ